MQCHTRHPNAVEVCDIIIDKIMIKLIDDEDDNLLSTQLAFYLDSDQDGFGNPNVEQSSLNSEQYVTKPRL